MSNEPEADGRAEDDETAYLMRGPANAGRLMAAIERLENGLGVQTNRGRPTK